MVGVHKSHGREGTIVVTRMEEHSTYGVVVYEQLTGKVDKFAEKPQKFVSKKINAGLYIFKPSSKRSLNTVTISLPVLLHTRAEEPGQGARDRAPAPSDIPVGLCLFLLAR